MRAFLYVITASYLSLAKSGRTAATKRAMCCAHFTDVRCHAGHVLMYESWLRHEVPVNMSDGDRISVSFNYSWGVRLLRARLERENEQADIVRFSLSCPSTAMVTPMLSQNVVVPSFSDRHVGYEVLIDQQTCTCPDFQSRFEHPRNHFSRWCKHLIWKLARNGAFVEANDWHKAIVNEGYGGPIDAFVITTVTKQTFLATVGFNDNWINIYGRRARSGEKAHNASGTIKQFGWSIVEKRWSCGVAPPGARELRALLTRIEGMERF